MTVSAPAKPPFKIIVASTVGSIIEFYDFMIYGTAAALVFSVVFFPSLGAAAGTAVALATFGIPFLIRPLGSVIFGYMGDRIGRKKTLVWTFLLMGASTVVIGLLPTAEVIGVAAPILLVLLRVVQGFALAGEWAGAALVTTENAPKGTRGRYGMYPQLGPAIGFFLACITFLITAVALTPEQFVEWGWRLPFLGSAALIVVGLVVRLSIGETAVFRADVARKTGNTPLRDLFKYNWRQLLVTALIPTAQFGLFYVGITYMISYATLNLGLERPVVLAVSAVGAVVIAITTVLSGILSDRFGRLRTLVVGNVMCLVAALVLFPVVNIGTAVALLIGLVLLQAAVGVAYGPLGAFIPERFGPANRYSGASIAYNIGALVGGGLTPIVAGVLVTTLGEASLGIYIALLCALSLVGLALSRRMEQPRWSSLEEDAPVSVSSESR